MLHKAFVITEIALRYYKITHPERKYTRHYAVKQWRQDKNIDKSVVQLVLSNVFEQQKKLLK
jgi:hypothetical protein